MPTQSRPSIDTYMMQIAFATKTRATCQRRAVGAVIVDVNNYILSTGYNGTPKGTAHCIDVPCAGISYASGQGLDICQAIHAEVNAICHCRDISLARTIYVTTSPCMSCMKMISATPIDRIVYFEHYADDPINYFNELGRKTHHIKM